MKIYSTAITQHQRDKGSNNQLSRQIYLSYPTHIFKDHECVEFKIKNRICEFLNIPFTSIQVAGSAKTGYSYYKKKEFECGTSDLDIAIISPSLFTDCLDYIYRETDGHTDLTGYHRGYGQKKDLMNEIFNGFINPMDLPRGQFKSNWLSFFNSLSSDYSKYFKNINAGIYATQYIFEMRQYRAIKIYLEERGEKC